MNRKTVGGRGEWREDARRHSGGVEGKEKGKRESPERPEGGGCEFRRWEGEELIVVGR